MPSPVKKSKKKWITLALLLLVFLLILSGIISLFWLIPRGLFSRNSHFTLRHLDVHSKGWWHDRGKLVADIFEIKIGQTNLFALNLAELRKKLAHEPSIEYVSVARKLPDTLDVSIVGRIPRAVLDSRNPKWVVDGSGIVMDRERCVISQTSLPLVEGPRSIPRLSAGMALPQLQPALDLIMLTVTDFPDLRISAVTLKYPGKMVAIVDYKGDASDRYIVYLPRNKQAHYLNILLNAIMKAKRERNPRRKVDLRFKGKVVWQ